MNVRLTNEQKTRILNSEDVYSIMQQILLRENKIGRHQEDFWIIGLDNANKILFIELISLGATNRVDVKPREVFRMAIYKLAVKAILVHNHPSGNLTPSDPDKDTTDKLLKSGDMLGIEVIDHLIIGEDEYLSFEDTGLIAALKESGYYELKEREKEDLLKWKVELEKDRAVKKFAKEMAKKMKDMEYDLDVIKEITGMRKSDIRKL